MNASTNLISCQDLDSAFTSISLDLMFILKYECNVQPLIRIAAAPVYASSACGILLENK